MATEHTGIRIAGLVFGLTISIAPLAVSAGTAPDRIPDRVIATAMQEADCWLSLADVKTDLPPAQRLDDRFRLLEIPCWRAAYQAGSMFLAFEAEMPKTARLLRFPIPEADGFIAEASLTFPDFDPATRRLTSLHRARGLGDCGSAGRWIWIEDAFVLEHYWRKDDCDGTLFDPFNEPQRWRVYP